MSDTTLIANEKETVKKIKRELEGWREIVLQLNSVLLWDKPWYPGVLVGFSTVLFTLLWLADPSLLSTVSCVALLVVLLDYLVPTLCANLYSPAHWTGVKEKQFEDICKSLASGYCLVTQQFVAFKNLKESSPKLYYSVTILSLALLAFIGNEVNNLWLTYLIVTTLLLMPGLFSHGILEKYYQLSLHSVANVLKSFQGGNKLKTK